MQMRLIFIITAALLFAILQTAIPTGRILAQTPPPADPLQNWRPYDELEMKMVSYTYYLKLDSPIMQSFTAAPPSIAEGQIDTEGTDTPPSGEVSIWERWETYFVIGALLCAILIIAFLIERRRRITSTGATGGFSETQQYASGTSQQPIQPETSSSAAATTTAARSRAGVPTLMASKARLVLPSGAEIHLPADVKALGRNDFAGVLSSDKAGYISRSHAIITYDNGTFYIEDTGSSNGTRLSLSVEDSKPRSRSLNYLATIRSGECKYYSPVV